MNKMTLGERELTKLANLWDFHKCDCNHRGDVTLEYRSGGGIGTVTVAICGCGKELDITDHTSW
jgi:hypothetical protein